MPEQQPRGCLWVFLFADPSCVQLLLRAANSHGPQAGRKCFVLESENLASDISAAAEPPMGNKAHCRNGAGCPRASLLPARVWEWPRGTAWPFLSWQPATVSPELGFH